MERVVILLETIAEGTTGWVHQFRREQDALRSEYEQVVPEWFWSKDIHEVLQKKAWSARSALGRSAGNDSAWYSLGGHPYALAKDAIAVLLNAFPLSLSWHGDAPIETPPYHLLHGIRPLLFALLRRDLMLARQVRMCSRSGCGNYFLVSRTDKACCSLVCSAKVAAQKRYHEKVKPARQEAAKQKQANKKTNTEISRKDRPGGAI